MPILKASIKDVRRTKKRTINNSSKISALKTYIKKVQTAKTAEEAKKIMEITVPLIDKAVSKKLFHKNKAARLKSNLAKRTNQLSTAR